MEIPLKLRALKELHGLNGFGIVWFQNNKLKYPSPHWHIFIRVAEQPYFLVALITSKIDNRIKYYSQTKAPKATACLVRINSGDYAFIRRPSAVDCNATEYLSIEEIIHRIDETKGFNVETKSVSAKLQKEIVSAIIMSPMTAPFMHELAKAASPA